MAIQQSSFGEIGDRMKPGDIIAFSGRNRFSRLVRLATGSMISGVGIVCDSGQGSDIINSVTFKQTPGIGNDIDGESRRRMSKRIDSYDGLVWWLPLSDESRSRLNIAKLCDLLRSMDCKKYKMPQSIRNVLNMIEENPFFDLSSYKQKDLDAFFCSQLAAFGLRVGGVISNINPCEVTPANLCSFNLFAEDYYQLKGRRKQLDEYNERDPEGFGWPKL